MSKYSALDAHSRNCPSCIRQRELDIPVDHGEHGKEKKKTSLPCEKRKMSGSGSRTSLVKRSNSSLSFSSDVGVLKKEDSFDGSAYLTPTQRKNQEIKRLRLELAKANELLQTRDKEMAILRREVAALKESGQMNDSWTAETGSITDSGNCEESCSTSWDPDQEVEGCSNEPAGHKLENIDFELMETALKEEEETRHKLEAGNDELKDQLIDVRRELAFTKDQYEEETSEMKKNYEDELIEVKKENNQKTEELVNELAESSLRCARQQDAIEHKQNRLDDILRELTIYKENLTKSKEKIQEHEETLAKVKTDIEQPKYLNLVTKKADCVSEDSQTDPKNGNDAGCQTENPEPTVLPSSLCITTPEDNTQGTVAEAMYPKGKAEPSCDNKIHYTYQFLKRSIYYFITDKENSAYHLKSIERLLEFNDLERSAINRSKPVIKKY